jgi:hypothetical protein
MLALGGEGYGNVVHAAVQSRIFAASGRRTYSSNEADARMTDSKEDAVIAKLGGRTTETCAH